MTGLKGYPVTVLTENIYQHFWIHGGKWERADLSQYLITSQGIPAFLYLENFNLHSQSVKRSF